jgi:hypothetical protein
VRDNGIRIGATMLSLEGLPGHWDLKMCERSRRIARKWGVWSEHGAGIEVEVRSRRTRLRDHSVRRFRLFKEEGGGGE